MVAHVPTPPRNLDELRAVTGNEQRVAAADAYLARVHDAQQEARALREEAIRGLITEHGPSKAARLAGVSLTTVKAIRRRA